jgi:hypothetical protein
MILNSLLSLSSAYQKPQTNLHSTRRSFLSTSSALVAATANTSPAQSVSTATSPTLFNDEIPKFIGPPPMIRQYPELQFLIPIYTFKLSLKILSKQLLPSSGSLGIQRANRMLEQFFSGGFLSNKNVFRGMCVVYIQEIQYDDPDRDRINFDRLNRLDDIENMIKALESIREPLSNLAKENAETVPTEIVDSLNLAVSCLDQFFSKIPSGDVEKVQLWMEKVNSADSDRSGKLEGPELDTLNESDRLLYKSFRELIE